MALMCEQGWPGMEKPDFAIFADTVWEPKKVYEHLDRLETRLNYEVGRVKKGNLGEDVL